MIAVKVIIISTNNVSYTEFIIYIVQQTNKLI